MDLLEKVKQLLGGQKMISPIPQPQQQAPKFLTDIGNTLQNANYNFWHSSIGKGLVGAQKVIENPNPTTIIPQITLPRNISSTPVLGQVSNMVANIPGNLINTVVGKGIIDPSRDISKMVGNTIGGRQLPQYSTLSSPQVRFGYQLGTLLNPAAKQNLQIKTNPKELLANTAGTIEAPFSIYSGGKVFGLGKDALINNGAKSFLPAISQGFKEGAGYGAKFGLLQGLQESKDIKDPVEYAKAIGSTVLQNYLAGGVTGSALSGSGYVFKSTREFVQKALEQQFPNLSLKQTNKIVDGYIRDLKGRFAEYKSKSVKGKYPSEIFGTDTAKYGNYQEAPLSIKINTNPDPQLTKVMVSKSKADETFVPSKLKDQNVEPLPWETPEFKKLNPNFEKNLIPTDSSAQYKANIKGGGFTGNIAEDVKSKFADWVNARRATKVEEILKKQEFSDLNNRGMQGIFDFQKGIREGRLADVQKYFDEKRLQVKDTGIDVNYKQYYLPQLWANTEQEVQQALGRSLGTKPSFTLESVIKDYKQGIDKKLTPRFNTIADLVGWYERTANKAIADKTFFDSIAKEGLIAPSGQSPRDWVTLSPDRFPKVKVKTTEGNYSGTYKAPAPLAKMINNYLNSADEGVIARIADFTSRAKNVALSFGVPNTGVNAHGFNILARHTLFGTGGNPITRLATGVKYMLNPQSAMSSLEKDLATAPRAIKAGLTLSAEEHNGLLNEAETLAKSLGKKWNNAFEVPLFNKMIPSLKLSSFNELVKNGVSEKDAAKMINNVYGGINWEQLGRDRNTQNLLRAVFLAPDWAETSLRLGGNIAKSFTQGGPVGARYRTMASTLLGSIVALNIANKLTSGHYAYENDAGHTFELEAGYTPDGQKRYVRPYGTAVDFVRLPVDAILGLAKGDPSPTFRAISNRLSMPLSSATHLLTNTDYTGKPIYGKDRYGKEIPAVQSIGGVGSEIIGGVGFPSFAKNAIDVATGKQGVEQGLTQGFELPFRYSGGSFSPSDKKIADALSVSGKERYDLSKTLRDQSAFSVKQLQAIQSGGQNALNQIIQKRANDKIISDVKKQAENGDLAPKGNLVPVNIKGTIKVIDTSYQPQAPQLTGNSELDKKLMSQYTSDINSKINDIVDLYKGNKISASEANAQIAKLQSLKPSSNKPKKISIKMSKAKLPKTNIKKFKLKAPKAIKVKKLNIKSLTPTKKRSIKIKV